MINLEFAGIKGDPSSKPCRVQVPCIEMWGDSCPILADVRPWFKDKSLEDMGRKYWKKRSYIFQGFVKENPLADDETPENPIRRFIIGPQIFALIKGALMDPEMEELPTDYAAGLDFVINKTEKGGYADYSTSKWARKESALSTDEAEAIEVNGLFDLNDFLPNKPSAEDLVIMHEMFEASVNGEAYDPEKWAAHFRPKGVQLEGYGSNDSKPAEAAPATPAPAATPAPVVEEAAPAAEEVPATDTKAKADDILAMIRNRQKTN
jgi:hypothetical protein